MDNKPLKNFVINIAQWNAQSVMSKKHDLELLLNRERIHICLLSETWLDSPKDLKFKDYNVFRKDRFDCYGGVAIVIHKSIQCHFLPVCLKNPGIEIVSIKILNCENLDYISSVYCPSSIVTSQCDWDDLFSKFSHKSVLAGDFNGHHSDWSSKTDTRGTQIYDACTDNNFISLNDKNPTRIKLVNNSLQTTSPDITFATSDIAIHFNWQTTNENLGSDHLFIKFNIGHKIRPSYFKRRNMKLANWNLYQQTLKNRFNPPNSNNVQSMYNYFIDEIMYAADKAIPMKKICSKPIQDFQPKPYWEPSLSQIIAERRLALKKFRRNPTPNNFDKLTSKVAEARRLIKKAKNKN